MVRASLRCQRIEFTAASWRRWRGALEDDDRHFVILGMTECDQGRSDAARCRQFLSRPGKDEKRFAAIFFADVDVAPAHRLTDPGAERFGHRFFAGKEAVSKAFGDRK